MFTLQAWWLRFFFNVLIHVTKTQSQTHQWCDMYEHKAKILFHNLHQNEWFLASPLSRVKKKHPAVFVWFCSRANKWQSEASILSHFFVLMYRAGFLPSQTSLLKRRPVLESALNRNTLCVRSVLRCVCAGLVVLPQESENSCIIKAGSSHGARLLQQQHGRPRQSRHHKSVFFFFYTRRAAMKVVASHLQE